MGYPPKRADAGISALFAVLLFIIYGANHAAGSEAASTGLLDGKVFLVEKGEKGEEADGKDTYIFRDGMFRSVNYEKDHGFIEGAYKASQQGDIITFAADTESETQGRIHWEGTVGGDRIDVRYTWTGKKPKWYQSAPEPTEHWARLVTAWPTEDPGPPEGRSPSNLLDGRTFIVSGGAKGKKEVDHHDDYLVFQDGLFVSSHCMSLVHFRASSYSVTPKGDGIRFRSTTTSPTHGTMTWDGTIRGNVIDATTHWVEKRWYWTIDRAYWWKGQLLE
ncbi:MAG: hypothetical protein WBX50_11360 [Candidatus Deferrimicrobiaceae bacterium]